MKVVSAVSTLSSLFKRQFPEMTVIENPQNIPNDIDLLILTGGEDINPARYGEPILESYGISEERDDIEFTILRTVRSLNKNTKILGVCRGLQLLNVAFGGNLYQDLDSSGMGHNMTHSLEYKFKGHPLAWLNVVNSLHHQAIREFGGGILPVTVVAQEPNTKLCEAVAWSNNIFGVQYHPEMFSNDLNKKFFDIIKAWINNKLSLQQPGLTSTYIAPPAGIFTTVNELDNEEEIA